MRKIILIGLALVLALGIVGLVKASPSPAATERTTTRYQQADPKITYVGTWEVFSVGGASGGSYRRSSSNAASATVTFNGTYLAWIATKGTTLGKAFVSLDGGPAVGVDLSRSSVAYQQKVWSTGRVRSGQHTVKIWRDPSSASGKYISIDAIDVTGASASPPITTSTTLAPTTSTAVAPTTTTLPPTTSTTLPPATSTTLAPTTSTTLASTTTTTAAPSTTTTTIPAPSGTLSVKDYGAKGDGSTNDRAAIQSAINAAAGKTVYFPAGTYFMSQTSVFLTIPSGVTLQGEGDASVLRFQDDGLDKRSNGLQIVGRSNVAIRNLKLMGTQANKQASLQLIRADYTNGLTLDNVTFDGGEYALRTTGSGSSPRASNITVTNCRTLSNVLNPFYFAYATNVRVSGCTLDANRVDCMPGRYPHHFYVNDGMDGLYVSGCTLSGGQHVSIDAHSDGGTPPTNLYFSNIVLNEVFEGIYGSGVGNYSFDGVTLRSSRYESGYPMVNIHGVQNFTIKNFDFDGTVGKSNYLVYIGSCNSALFQDGIMTHSAELGNALPGCAIEAGQAPTYINVTVR